MAVRLALLAALFLAGCASGSYVTYPEFNALNLQVNTIQATVEANCRPQ